MKKLLLGSLFLLIFLHFSTGKTYALTPATNSYTDIFFCNNNPTDWQVTAYYKDINDLANPILLGSSFSMNQGTSLGWDTCPGHYWAYEFVDQKPDVGDKVHWYQACVDPDVDVNVNATIIKDTAIRTKAYETDIPAACLPYDGTATYAGCYNLNFSSVNYGTVSSDAQCPYYKTSDSYCTIGGVTGWQTLCGASYCGGTNNCTYYDKSCGGTSCGYTAYPNDLRCGVSCGATATPTPTPGPTATPAPTPVACPNYAPPATTTQGTCPAGTTCIAQQPSQTVQQNCSPAGATCSPSCSFTCIDSQGRTCPATSCSTVWACQSGTQWFNDGRYYYTCPASCPSCVPGSQTVTCSAPNVCPVP